MAFCERFVAISIISLAVLALYSATIQTNQFAKAATVSATDPNTRDGTANKRVLRPRRLLVESPTAAAPSPFPATSSSIPTRLAHFGSARDRSTCSSRPLIVRPRRLANFVARAKLKCNHSMCGKIYYSNFVNAYSSCGATGNCQKIQITSARAVGNWAAIISIRPRVIYTIKKLFPAFRIGV
jgi:hypothetical protein